MVAEGAAVEGGDMGRMAREEERGAVWGCPAAVVILRRFRNTPLPSSMVSPSMKAPPADGRRM